MQTVYGSGRKSVLEKPSGQSCDSDSPYGRDEPAYRKKHWRAAGQPGSLGTGICQASGSVCVLKDACTVTTGSDGTVWYNLSGNAGWQQPEARCNLQGFLPECSVCTEERRFQLVK